MSPEPVHLGDALKDVMHILGGDTCREFLGHNQGYCGAPSDPGVGLCAKHRLDRAEWEYDMRTRQEG